LELSEEDSEERELDSLPKIWLKGLELSETPEEAVERMKPVPASCDEEPELEDEPSSLEMSERDDSERELSEREEDSPKMFLSHELSLLLRVDSLPGHTQRRLPDSELLE